MSDLLQKVVYIDFDKTLCSRPKVEDTQIVFEDYDRGLPQTSLMEIFPKSYISKNALSYLGRLKQSGVTLIGVTARDRFTGLHINQSILKLFDRIYCGSCLYCYDVKNNSFSLDYTQKVSTMFLQDIQNKRHVLEQILAICKIKTSIYPTEGHEAFVYLKEEDCRENYETFSSYCAANQLPLLHCENLGLIEVRLVDVSKSIAVDYDRSFYEKSYAICIGDSSTDYEMLEQCDLGIYPNGLVGKLRNRNTFTYMGSDVSKIVAIEDENFMRNNLREALASFAKVDKNLD